MTKFSIIVATYNAERSLKKLLNSIVSQNYKYELLVIDGGSTDTTVSIIQDYSKYISYWVSEQDEGIYDAWNKGVVNSSGDWILFLGADDILMHNTLNNYSDYICKINKDVLYISSRIQMVDINGKRIRIKGWRWEWPRFLNGMTVAHPGSLHSRKLFDKYGLFNTSYKITGDYELLLRPKDKLTSEFMDIVTVEMSEGGVSDSLSAIKEYYLSAVNTGNYPIYKAYVNRVYISAKFLLRKLFRKLGLNIYIRR